MKTVPGARVPGTRVVHSVLPLDVIVADGEGTISGDGTRALWSRVLGVYDGTIGHLVLPPSPLARDDARNVSRYGALRLAVVREPASPRTLAAHPPIDLTDTVATVGRIARAHDGDTEALRQLLALLVSLANEGKAVAEVSDDERPAALPPFEVFEMGAQMPAWSQRAYGAFFTQVAIVFPDDGGWKLTLTDQARAPQLYALEPPVGPNA